MKKSFLIVTVTLLSLSSLTTYATRWKGTCAGGGTVYFTTSDDTTQKQASAMTQAWCDNRAA